SPLPAPPLPAPLPAMGSGRCCPFLPALLPALLLPPAAWGDCGPLPNISHAEPPEDAKHGGSFTVGSKVTYRCLAGYVKRPLLPDTIQCLANSQWSNLQQFCVRSCPSPPRVRFAKISQEDETQSFYPVGITVRYICRPGYENTTDQLPTSTCLDNLTWSAVPELCQKIPCLAPPVIENGQLTDGNRDFVFGMAVTYSCNKGFSLIGDSTIHCAADDNLNGMWSGPAPECKEPPTIDNGMHNGTKGRAFVHGSVVVYKCKDGFALAGVASIRCTVDHQDRGVWSKPTPECKRVVPPTEQLPDVLCEEPPMTDNGMHNGTKGRVFVHGSVVVYRCKDGFTLAGGFLKCSEVESAAAAKRINGECLHVSDTYLKKLFDTNKSGIICEY
uniref:Sushi domain-containing protein n=1 Tax=Strix occidentalis caurina TaxID=311401 RepID=A0A8D0KUX0_STROC